MNKKFGCQDMTNTIRKVLIKDPKSAYKNQANIDTQYEELNYFGKPDFEISLKDYNSFKSILHNNGIEIHCLPSDDITSLDSIYTHDPCLVSNSGVILCSMGKDLRKKEPEMISNYFESLGIPIIGRISSPGKLEGGDIVWIDNRTVAVGVGYRSNFEGIMQLKQILSDDIDEIIPVHLPHWTGPADCLHLMSNVSPIDENLFLVYSKLLPVSFREYLLSRKIKLIEVPDEEYESMGCNVLAIAPRKVIMIEGNNITKKILEDEGVEIFTYPGLEISNKGAGGPTCLTRPFLRSE
ncbi:MAG: dimethylarginine dimethylaminohydrolase family protein [Candidatus Neomarinimicrobiota bacterium]